VIKKGAEKVYLINQSVFKCSMMCDLPAINLNTSDELTKIVVGPRASYEFR
jgi:hypothetical protein